MTLGRLKEAAQVLIDIHGQHEHQSLLYKKIIWQFWMHFKKSRRMEEKVADSYREYRRLEKELKEADKDTRLKESQRDFFS